jgi:glycosyltransferase involved in cell wall biosynthesis
MARMTIGIDASRAVNETAGIGRYTKNTVEEMLKLGRDDAFKLLFTFVRGRRDKWREIGEIVGKTKRASVSVLPIPGPTKEWVWETYLSPIDFLMRGSNVFFAPSFFEVPLKSRLPIVVTVHDLSHALFPSQRGPEVSKRLTEREKRATKIAKIVIVPSEATKKDLVKVYGVDPGKIVAIPEAQEALFRPLHIPRKDFLLFVGTLSPRKNLERLLTAYSRLPISLRARFPLYIAGAPGWNLKSFEETVLRLKLGNSLNLLGFVPDPELLRLYNEATAMVWPPLHEGFGIPILEAFACGCPVVTSKASSMPEAAGDAALYIDPKSISSILSGLTRILESESLRKSLAEKGLKQARKFSWKRTAEKTLEVLHDVGRSV